MLKTVIYRFLSEVCWWLGADQLSFLFLTKSMVARDALRERPWVAPTVDLKRVGVVFIDTELVLELGDRVPKGWSIPTHVHDIN